MTCQFKQLICRLLWSTSCIAIISEHQTGKHNLTKTQFSEENDGLHKARPSIAAAVSGNCQLCSSSSSSSSSWTILLWTDWQVRKGENVMEYFFHVFALLISRLSLIDAKLRFKKELVGGVIGAIAR